LAALLEEFAKASETVM